jgi:hypothetical protein
VEWPDASKGRDDGEDDKVMGSLENNGSFVWEVVGGEKSVFTTQKKAAWCCLLLSYMDPTNRALLQKQKSVTKIIFPSSTFIA